tara:strand:- start:2049 stop:2309 length:261 start_codon:yes stop_codon:yes gene_type:complete
MTGEIVVADVFTGQAAGVTELTLSPQLKMSSMRKAKRQILLRIDELRSRSIGQGKCCSSRSLSGNPGPCIKLQAYGREALSPGLLT